MPDPTPPPAPTADPAGATPPEPAAPPAPPDPSGDAGSGDQLGEGGKKALEAERANRKAAEARAKELEAQIAELQKAQMSEAERAVAEAEARGRAAADAEWLERHAKDQLALAAAGKLADPADAAAFISTKDVLTSDGKAVDPDRISAALDGLLKAKPHLAGATPPRFGPADLGGTPGPQQLTREDLRRMTPDQIEEARTKGQLDSILAGKS